MANVTVNASVSNINVSTSYSNITVTDDGVVVSNITVIDNNINVGSTENIINVAEIAAVSDADVRAALGNTAPILYNVSTGIFSFDSNAAFSGKTTDDLAEGSTNLYFTNARVDARVPTSILNNSITLKQYYDTVFDNGNISGNVTIDVANGGMHKANIAGNITGISVANVAAGTSLLVVLEQDAVGLAYLDTTTSPSNWTDWKFVNDDTALNAAPNGISYLGIVYDGEYYHLSVLTDAGGDLIPNSQLANSNVIINGITIPLGSSATLTTANIAENTNLYFTAARARGNVSATDAGGLGSFAYSNTTGVFTYTGPSDSDVRNLLSSTSPITYSSATGVIGLSSTANISTTGNISGGYILGNGSLLTGLPATYGNSNVANFLTNGFGSNNITTTGTITAGTLSSTTLTSSTGNVTVASGKNLKLSGSNPTIIGDVGGIQNATIQFNTVNVEIGDYSTLDRFAIKSRATGNVLFQVGSHIAGSGSGTADADVRVFGNVYIGTENQLLDDSNAYIKRDGEVFGQYFNSSGNITTSAYILGNGSLLTGVASNAGVVSYIATQPLTVGGNLTVNGNLDVTGNVNYQNVTDLYVRDQIIVLNANASTNADVQIIANRPTAQNAIIKWIESQNKWMFSDDAFTSNAWSLPRSTTDLAEGTNLYFTTARANTAIDTRVNKSFVDGLGVEYSSLANSPTNVSFFANDAGYLVAANLASLTANVDSVNGQTGVVVLDTGDITEGTNLYYTTDRANTAIDTRVNKAFVEGLGVSYTSLANTPTAVSAFTNDVGYLVAANLASLTANVDSVNGQTGVVVLDTDDIAEGSNLYYSNARVNAFIQDNITTTDIDEGTNLYYTTARANTAIDDYVLGSENIDVTGGVISLTNALGNVNSVTAEANVNFAINTDEKLILSQQYKNTTTYSGNISGQGYAVIGGRLAGTAVAHTGANAIPTLYITGGFTIAGTNEISNVTVQWYGNSAAASVSDIKSNYAFTTQFGNPGQTPFPQGTYVTSVDAANSKVFMSQIETTGFNAGVSNGTFSPGARDPETGLLISFVSAEAGGAGAANVILATLVHTPGLYAYPESGWDPSYFTYAIDTASDYNMSGTTDLAWAKTSIEGNKSILNSPYGLTLGSRTDASQMGTDDTRPRFGLNVLWDSLTPPEEFGNTTPTTGVLLRQYNDPAYFDRQDKARSGPSIVFTASEGNASQSFRETYTRNNTELGKIAWVTPSSSNPAPSFNVPQVWINCLTGQDALVGSTGGPRVSGAGVYFANSPNVLNPARGLYFANTKGNTLIAGGAFGTSKINFGPMSVSDATGNSASMYVAAEGNKFAQIGYANTSTARGSEVAVTNGRRYGSPAVGDLQFTFNRIDNTNGTVPSVISYLDNEWNYIPTAESAEPADMIVTEQTLILPTGTAVVPSGFTGDYGNAVNGNTYYVENIGSAAGARFYFLYTDVARTTPLDLGIAGGDYGAGIYTYTFAAGVSGVTNKTWNIALEEQSADLKFKANGSTVATITDAGNVSATNFIGNVTGNVTGFVSSISNFTTSDLGEGTNLYYTDSRARASISGAGDISYDANTGVISYTGTPGDITDVIAGDGLTGGGTSGNVTLTVGAGTGITVNADNVAVNMGAFTTTDLAEGSNLYYTDTRANTAIDTRVNKAFVEGLGVSYTSLTDKPTIPTHTSNLTNDSGFITSATANVVSVNGETGVVVLDTGDIAEGANLYYTDARANTAIDTRVNKAFVDALGVEYNSLANTPTNVSFFSNDAGYLIAANLASLTANVTSVNGETGVVVLDTGDIAENGNLYFTTDRANTAIDTRVNKAFVDALGVDYNSLANTPTAVSAFTNDAGYLVAANLVSLTANVDSVNGQTGVVTLDTDDIAEGSNLYYSNARVNAFIQDNITTSDIDEGTNLYYTTDRANTAIGAYQGSISTTGNIATTGNINAGYYFGNGAFLTGITSSYGDSNVTTLLANFGSNTISTTGNITAGNTVVNGVAFNTAGTTSPSSGQIVYNSNFGTHQAGLNGSNVMLMGQDLVVYARNDEANTLSKGEVVYISGAQGNKATVRRAKNDSDDNSATTIGIVKSDIAAGQLGYIVSQGVVDGINLSAYTEGDKLYLGNVAGTFTNVKPEAPAHYVFIGVVERANPGNGQILVRVQNGFELNEIHDVKLTNIQQNDMLIRNSGNTLWVNQNFNSTANAAIAAYQGNIDTAGTLRANSVTVHGTTNVTLQVYSNTLGTNSTGMYFNVGSATNNNAGFGVLRPTGTETAFLLWDEATDTWQFNNGDSTFYKMATSTTDLAEGANLYFSNARVVTAVETSNIKLKQFGETVVSLGSVSGDISSNIDVANGTIYQLTATGGITINSLANAAAGTSATIIVTQDGTGGHTLTSSMLFAGASKTLSTAPNSIDIISVFYDGTTYYATLSKGYA